MQNFIATVLLAGSISLLGCKGPRQAGTPADSSSAAQSGGTAHAFLHDLSGQEMGTVTLRDSGGRITLSGELSGIPPGIHAIHLHTVGRCDRPKYESAGSHWNPTGREHGTQNPNGPHLGDLPNLPEPKDGWVKVDEVSPGGTLRGANPLLDSDGASVVIHAKADDYKTNPSGNSGDRIACGVVGE